MTDLTETEIVNKALRLLGSYRIENFRTDQSPEAQTARDVYDEARRYVLASHEWRFAITGGAPARAAYAPQTRYGYAYPLPPDMIRLVEISDRFDMLDPLVDWEIQTISDGSVQRMCLVTNSEAVFIEYVYDHLTVGAWPPHFVATVTAYLSAQLAASLKSVTETERLMGYFDKQLGAARGIDSTQETSRPTPPGTWIRAMRGKRV